MCKISFKIGAVYNAKFEFKNLQKPHLAYFLYCKYLQQMQDYPALVAERLKFIWESMTFTLTRTRSKSVSQIKQRNIFACNNYLQFHICKSLLKLDTKNLISNFAHTCQLHIYLLNFWKYDSTGLSLFF